MCKKKNITKENKIEYLVWIIFASIGAIFVIVGLVAFMVKPIRMWIRRGKKGTEAN